MNNNITLADMDRNTAENEAVRMFTDLYNKIDEKTLDITKIEFIIRNVFGAACKWKEATSNNCNENLGADDIEFSTCFIKED